MLGIVILNYNEWDMSVKCINSIRETINEDYRIYLVDNCSTNKDIAFFDFLEASDDICFIQSDINRGYAGGNNLGIKRAINDHCDLYLITNNDVVFYPGSIDTMETYIHNNEKVGIVGPKIYTPEGKIQEINMGCKMSLRGKYLYVLRKTPLKKLSRNFVRVFHCEEQSLLNPFKVYAVSGCCFMVRGEVMQKLYPLDEGTFLYEEENIIGCRMENMGFETVYCTDAEILHLGGGSTKKESTFSYICMVNSEIYYCKKYLKRHFLELFPLYIIRTIVYIKEYGVKGLKDFFTKTFKSFSR